MPVNVASLQAALKDLGTDPDAAATVAGKPATAADMGAAWGDAIQGYAAAVIPASTTVAAAVSGLKTALGTAFALPDGVSAMEAAFGAFAGTVAGGMAGAGYTGVVPPAPVGFAAEAAKPHPVDAAAFAAAWASLIDTWFRTGTATLIAPPNTVVLWS